MKGNILLTGFEPFGGSHINPSIEACRKLEGKKINGYTVKVEEIPLRYDMVRSSLIEAIERHEPKAIICTGQAGSGTINLERVAINIADARIPYNCGTQPRDEPIQPSGPDAYFTKLPLRELLIEVKKAKIPVVISNSAGTFGCNHIFYELMHYLKVNDVDVPGGFIHVPALPEQVLEKRLPSMCLDLIADGLETVVTYISGNL